MKDKRTSPPKPTRLVTITLRVTETERAHYQTRALARGYRQLSPYIRSVLNDEMCQKEARS